MLDNNGALFVAVPEPKSFALLATGSLVMLYAHRMGMKFRRGKHSYE